MSSRRHQPRGPNNPLRVGFATPSLGRGGAERWVLTLCKAFSKAITVPGIITWDIEGALAPEARGYARLFWPHESEEFFSLCDVVIAWGLYQLPQVKGIESFQGKIIACSHGASRQAFHRKTNADMASIPGCIMTAVSDAAALSFPDGSDVTVIPNGVEVERCTPRKGREKTRELLGIPDDAKVALFFGRLGTEKRPLLLAEAVLQSDEWWGVFCGFDCEGVGAKLPQDQRIIHLEPEDAPGDLLAAADCFVLPSLTEAHPLALTEAWIAGVPTVYCDWGFAQQIRSSYGEDLGKVIPVDTNPDEILRAMVSATHNTYRVKLARHYAWQDFTSTAMAARWENFLGVNHNFRRVCKPTPTVG